LKISGEKYCFDFHLVEMDTEPDYPKWCRSDRIRIHGYCPGKQLLSRSVPDSKDLEVKKAQDPRSAMMVRLDLQEPFSQNMCIFTCLVCERFLI
jgi:hypothetical protein